MMDEHGRYWSTFAAEDGRTDREIIAWAAAYAEFLRESPDRPGWCQKKADDEWQKYLDLTPPLH